MSSYRLAHISDPHLPPPPGSAWIDFALKRLMSAFAWRRKRKRHLPEVLSAIITDLKAHSPDHIAVTGDLTNFATAGEFAAAREWLAGLGAPEGVTVSPGNHDALVGAHGAERFAAWAPWLGDEAEAVFPTVRRRGEVAVVNLCSAIATAPHLAQGELGAAQLARLRDVLAKLKAEGLCRVVLIHHPITSGVVSRRKMLRDQEALLAVLREHGAEFVLHGHAHVAAVGSAAGPDGPIPVLGVPSASTSGGHDSPARWHCLEIERRDAGWQARVVARGFGDGDEVAELGRYVLTVG